MVGVVDVRGAGASYGTRTGGFGLVKHLKAGGKKVTIGGTITQLLGPASPLSQLGLIDRVILVTYSGTGKAVFCALVMTTARRPPKP